jgi:hypothetical protein
MMKSDVNGCSTCPVGAEQYEWYKTRTPKPRLMVQYDYRHTDGRLFACVTASLEDARHRRDLWLEGKASNLGRLL